MPLLLNIETATDVCSVCLSNESGLLSAAESEKPNSHSSVLTLLIENALSQAGFSVKQLDAVALSAGPGSYTGLRIGASVAKGLCYSLDIPFIAVSTLQSMAQGMKEGFGKPEFLYCPMLDARRMDVYTALYDFNLEELLPQQLMTINSASFSEFLEKSQIIFFGTGAAKCKTLIHHPHAVFDTLFQNSSKTMMALTNELYRKKQFSSPATFEPFYLQKFS